MYINIFCDPIQNFSAPPIPAIAPGLTLLLQMILFFGFIPAFSADVGLYPTAFILYPNVVF